MLRIGTKRAWRSAHGAALVEYTILMAVLVVVLPTVAILSGKVDQLLDGDLGLERPTGGPVEVEVPGCVTSGQCVAPPGLVEQCIEEFGYGATCGEFPLLVVNSTTGEDFVVPIVSAGFEDPEIYWALSDNNEDYEPPVYANNGDDGAGNTALLAGHEIVHPAARYCQSRGMYLPAIFQLEEMSAYVDELRLMDRPYYSSSQYWYSIGGFYPAPVEIAGNSARVYNMRYHEGEIGIPRIAGVGQKHRVRCAYGAPR